MRPARSLRSILAIITATLAGLSLVIVAFLIWVTSELTAATVRVSSAVETVYQLEEAEIDLLLHARAQDPLIARGIESAMRRRIATARADASSQTEARVLDDVAARIDAYLARASEVGSRDDRIALQGAALQALERAVAINLDDTRALQAEAKALDERSTALGIALGVVLVAFAAGVLLWLRRRALRPVSELAEAMRRFGAGDQEIRATEHGPAELREMSRRFNEMASALVTQREAQLALLAGVAHDLRQPLSTLAMSVGMLDPDVAPPQELRRLSDISNRQIGRLSRMVADFLDMSRLEGGELALELRDEDLGALIRDTIALHHGAALHDRIVLHLPPEPVRLRCDATRIEQVVANLVSNAMKYSPVDQPVDVELAVTGDRAALRVTDRGPGLSAADQARLFEPFRRVGAAARTVPGIGLGLYVVRRIVAAHRGTISVASEPGHGATFTVELPLAARVEHAASARA